MATASTFIYATPEEIFNVMSTLDTYEHSVVGCQEIRDRECLRRLRRLAEQGARA